MSAAIASTSGLTRPTITVSSSKRVAFSQTRSAQLVSSTSASRHRFSTGFSAAATNDSEPSTSQQQQQPPAEDSDDLLIEQQMAKRRPKANKTPPPPPPGSYKVISATRDQVYSNKPPNAIQQLENGIISFLALLFFVILCEGVFLAASGFMSESVDQFAQDVVYPAFSPTIVFFLLCSSGYGVWKTGGGRSEEGKDGSA